MAPDLLKNEKWTKKEDATILSNRLKHETFPNIAKLLKNGRSENNVKNRYHKLIKDNSNSSTNSNVQSVNRSNKNNDDDSDDDSDDDDDSDIYDEKSTPLKKRKLQNDLLQLI